MDAAERQNNGIGRWLWLKVLLSGIVMFFLLERALINTGSIGYLPSLLAIGTFTVPLAFLILLYSRNRSPHVSASSLLASVLWGGVLGTVLAGSLEYGSLVHLGTLPTTLIGLIEEAAKLIVPAFFILRRREHSEIDAIVIGAAAGAGFAAFESMGYGLVALFLSGGDINTTTQVLLLRGLTAPAAHIAWTAIVAAALWRTAHVPGGAAGNFIYTVFGVVLLHALWDADTPFGMISFVVLGLISLGWLLIHVRKATHYE
jgi:RsiW-degrading membrane proteinase PrsW (M82 family)